MLRGLAGDTAAYSACLHDLARIVRAYLGRRLGSGAHHVEDLTQEVLIAIHRKRDTYDPEQPLLPWVVAIARYRLIDHYRRQSIRATVPLEDVEEVLGVAEDTTSDTARDLDHLMAQLPPAQRAAITLVKIEGRSIEETAARTGLSPSNVKVSVHRGLKKLRALAQRLVGDEDRRPD